MAVHMDGVLLCDKPAGLTSHDVDVRLRRALREATGEKARVGHAGTLDPFATGLLVLLVGRATRVQRFLLDVPKTYEFVARFGAVSTTGDPEGEIVETGVVPEGDLELPVGEVRQRPPIYSAVRIAGRRAFTYAHRGEEVEMPERTVRVYRFDELWREGDRRGFVVECSAGTYIRSLVADLGDAYCEQLRRTAIGPFRVEDAGAPDELDRIQPLEVAVSFLPRVELAGEEARMAGHGRAVPGEGEGPTLLLDADGPIAIAEPAPDGMLKPVVGFRG
jgi:tRNA pseudouridine55 synthase